MERVFHRPSVFVVEADKPKDREEGGDEHAAADAHEDRQAQRPDVELRRALERDVKEGGC